MLKVGDIVEYNYANHRGATGVVVNPDKEGEVLVRWIFRPYWWGGPYWIDDVHDAALLTESKITKLGNIHDYEQ